MKRTEKEEMVGVLSAIFNEAQVGYLVDYRGLTVSQVTELRRRLHGAQSTMRVLKNRIAKLAIRETPFEPLSEQLVDTRALVYGEEPVAPAKVLTEFQKDSDKLQVLGGLLLTGERSSLLDATQVTALSRLPSRDELLAQLMGLLKAPTQKLVSTLNEVPAKFLRTLAAVKESKPAA